MLMPLILLLAFALGANGLNADVVWLDEFASVSDMGAFNPPYSPAQIIDAIRGNHVPLFFLLGAGWAQLAGWSQYALRFMSLAAGVLMIAWLYRFAADAVNRRTAIVSALLMSTTALVIVYFHELRMYTLLMLLAVMHSGLYWRLAHGFRVTRLTWLFFILTAAMLFYTHNFSIILFVGLGAYHLFFVPKSRRWLNIMFAWGGGASLFLPYVPLWIEGLLQWTSRSSIDDIRMFPSPEVMTAFAGLLVNGFYLLWLPLILSFGYALRRKRNSAIVRLLCIALIMILTLLFVTWQFSSLPISRMRYFLVLWFSFVVLFAYGLTSMPRWPAITALFLVLWGIAGCQLGRSAEILKYAGGMFEAHKAQMYPPLYEYLYHLKKKANATDYLIGFTVPMHNGRSPDDYYLQAQPGLDGVFLSAHHRRYRLERDVKAILDNHPYILFAYNPGDPSPNADKALEIIHREGYIPCAVMIDKPDWRARRYVSRVMDCGHEPAPIAYDNSVKVIDRFARYVPGSEAVQILTWWAVADEGLLNEYNVSMQIITPDWRNVQQTDRHLYELPPWDVIELSTEGLPPGDYRLMMILYHQDSGEKVSGVDLAGDETANIFSMLPFTIEPAG